MSARSALVRQLPCVACFVDGPGQHSPTEEHHLNLDGKAGQKRRGDEYSIPLCQWHHRGVAYPYSRETAQSLWGPSLALQSRKFRECYGSDDDLLARTNLLLDAAA